MSKILSILFLTLSVVTTAFISPVQTEAQNYTTFTSPNSPQIYTVNAAAGLHMRDENCNSIKVVANKTIIVDARSHSGSTAEPINCNIKGVNYEMIPSIAESGTGIQAVFYAKKFLSLAQGRYFGNGIESVVTATAGLNLRDKNCNRLATMPYNAVVQNNPHGPLDLIICEVRGTRYVLEPIIYNGRAGYAANSWLK